MSDHKSVTHGRIFIYSRGVDFDDPEYGFKEEDKDSRKVCLFDNHPNKMPYC